MSIIIRLQNLPWSANSVDIRRHFAGLSIPEGGVHIVGGEKGDAFIAFSTDEDARQAMERDGGKIKDMKVRLLLSSRTEMTRVIDHARNQNLSLQTPSAVKAAVNDSDRRKVRDRSPSPRRKDRDKSPGRDRERRRLSTKRDLSRSRSRSPLRRGRDRDRECERRGDRSKREDRRFDDTQRGRDDRYKNLRDSRDIATPMEISPEKAFDPRMATTPQSFDSRQVESAQASIHFGLQQQQSHLTSGTLPYLGIRNQPVPEAPYLFPAVLHSASFQQVKQPSEPMQPLPFPSISNFQDTDKSMSSKTAESYQKRPFATPAISALSASLPYQYTKGYGHSMSSDPYAAMAGDFRGPAAITSSAAVSASYSNAQPTDRGTVSVTPHERKSYGSSQHVYGAEPHARYDKIPEANQAGRSPNASGLREIDDHEMGLYGRRLPSNIPTVMPSTSNTAAIEKPTRRSRFEPEKQVSNEQPYQSKPHVPNMDSRRPGYLRPMEAHTTPPQSSEGTHQRERVYAANKDNWSSRPSIQMHSSWNNGRPGLLTPPQIVKSEEFYDGLPMEPDENELQAATPPLRSRDPGKGGLSQGLPSTGNRPHSRESFPFKSEHPVDDNFRGTYQRRNKREPQINEPIQGSPLVKTNEPSNRVAPKSCPPPSLTVEVCGLPYDACEADVLELFRGVFLPPENIKLKKDLHGQPSGSAFVKFLNLRDFEEGLSRSHQDIGNCCPEVLSCPSSVFENYSSTPSGPPQRKQNAPTRDLGQNQPQMRVLEQKIPPRKSTEIKPQKAMELSQHSQTPEQNRILRNSESSLPGGPSMKPNLPLRTVEPKVPPRQSVNAVQGRKLLEPPHSGQSLEKTLQPRKEKISSSKRQSTLKPCEEDLCLELKGIPYACKDDDIVNFFDGLSILDIFIERGPDGRATGLSFVEFATPADFHAALELNGNKIAHRYIDITIASKEIMSLAQENMIPTALPPPMKKPLFSHGPPREPPMHPPPTNAPKNMRLEPHNQNVFCVTLNGLPNVVKNRDIADFFGEANVIPRAIHIMLDPSKLPTGEAFAEFINITDSEQAIRQNGKVLAGARISVNHISYEEMCDILGGPPGGPPAPPPTQAPLLETPHADNDKPPQVRRPLIPVPPPIKDDTEMGDQVKNMPPAKFGRGRPLLEPDYQPEDAPRFDHPEGPRGMRPPFSRMRGPAPPRGPGSNRPVLRPPFRPEGPMPRGPAMFQPRHSRPQRPLRPHGPRF